MRRVSALIPLLAILVAACSASGAARVSNPAAVPTPAGEPSSSAPVEVRSDGPGPGRSPRPTPGGADVTGIDACALITQAEAEAALGVETRPPFGGGTPDVNSRGCLYASNDGNGPQVGVAVSGTPDPFHTPAAATVPGLGDEAWWWQDPRGFRLEARDGDRYVAFEFNDFRSPDRPTEAALDVLVPLMQVTLSRLP